MTAVGFVGLGDMGAPMAKHLLEAGHELWAFDIDETSREQVVADGATAASSPAAVAAASEVVFLSLPGPAAVETVVGELRAGLDPGTVVVDLSTSLPSVTNGLAAKLTPLSVELLGAPISGGKRGAQAASLSVMVGGDAATYAACEPLFAAFAPDRFHVGERPGDGHAVKLLNNFLSYNALLASSEALILGEAAGLDRAQLLAVFSASTGRNSATEEKLPEQVLTGAYDTGYPLSSTEKDVRLLTEFADQLDTPVLLGAVTRLLVGYARSIEGDNADMTAVYDFLGRAMRRPRAD
jgi:3-hydroxyisobutyrate dehydrogenase